MKASWAVRKTGNGRVEDEPFELAGKPELER